MKAIDLCGKNFGDLKVLREGVGKFLGRKFPKKRRTYICLCACGNEVEVTAGNLSRGNTTSCGCKFLKSTKYNFVDLTGQRFGFLKVSKKSDVMTKTRGVLWVCECDCGNVVELASNALTSFNNVTCGDKKRHYKNELDPKFKRVGEIPLTHINTIKQNAIKRNIPFSLSPEYLWELFLKQDKKCMLTGELLKFTEDRNASGTRALNTTASLDRIDNKKGYIDGNVRWVHKHVNIMRGSLSDEAFLEYCRKCFLNSYKLDERPTFKEYFLMLAFDVALRSEDLYVKHGAVIVNKFSNHIIGTGYNATLRKSDKKIINLENRDERRPWMIHAEENAIMNCSKNPLDLPQGAIIYVTGVPCVNCLQRIVNFGIKEVYFADRCGTITDNKMSDEMRGKIISMSGIKYERVSKENKWLKKVWFES
jgi:deoxycytidylate deaminase